MANLGLLSDFDCSFAGRMMPRQGATKAKGSDVLRTYVIDGQVGFLLRKANQRHTAIFARGMIAELTPTQFAALAKLYEVGSCSQNRLGRLTAMDAATIKGVIDRLTHRGFTEVETDRNDTRLLVVNLTKSGRATIERAIPHAARITEKSLTPLSARERAAFLKLLTKLC